jgi:hypothetical protein
MRTKSLCTSCEEYVYTDVDHSCRDAKAVRDAEAAVVAAAEVWDDTWTIASVDDHASSWNRHHEARNALVAAVTALHAARQGEG